MTHHVELCEGGPSLFVFHLTRAKSSSLTFRIVLRMTCGIQPAVHVFETFCKSSRNTLTWHLLGPWPFLCVCVCVDDTVILNIYFITHRCQHCTSRCRIYCPHSILLFFFLARTYIVQIRCCKYRGHSARNALKWHGLAYFKVRVREARILGNLIFHPRPDRPWWGPPSLL